MTHVRETCRGCGHAPLQVVWDLAPAPYGDRFLASRPAALALPSHGLTLSLCKECSLLQLAQEVDPVEIYGDYLYHSAVTVGLADLYRRLCRLLVSELDIRENALVVDVGSNDGTGVLPFRYEGMRIAGVEPSRAPAEAALANGVPTVNSFLNQACVDTILAEYGEASLVCANYVMANVSDPVSFLRLMRKMLKPSGAISVVTGYHPEQFAVNMFDYVNHDHLSYISVTSALKLGEMAGLRLTAAQMIPNKGGSIHLIFRPKECSATADHSIVQITQREKWLGVASKSMYEETARRINVVTDEVQILLQQVRSTGLVGVGASISTTHVLHQLSIGHLVDRLMDDDPRKFGLFSPGFGIRVDPLTEISSGQWDTALILAWQHTSTLIDRVVETGFTGKVLIPLPHPHHIAVG